METTPSLFNEAAPESAADLALSLSPSAAAGHFDELRGCAAPRAQAPAPPAAAVMAPLHLASDQATTPPASIKAAPASRVPDEQLSPAWTAFFNHLGTEGFEELNQRNASLQRQIRDNGVTYNVYADANGPQRPWALDLFPMLLTPQDWAQIETGVAQRARLLDRVMADVYGPQELLKQGLLPAALVQGHPGYLRPMQGIRPAGGNFLHIAAFDLARGPDGRWWVVSQRTQAPSGLGYLLENRLSISLQFPQAFREMKVQRLAASYRALVDGMKASCPLLDRAPDASGCVPEPRIVLLTPGPYNETYFEHAYLARYLGLTLVEGSDLLVRGERLYLKTLQGLEPVHGLLKRLDDEFLDPLELRSDSTLGVPGLLQAVRAGSVLVANAPGSAFLESSALLGFLPLLSRHLLGEALALPSLATWWCGERAAMQAVLPQLRQCVVKPTYPGTDTPSLIGQGQTQARLDEWAGRILRQGDEYTVQSFLPLPQTPTWQGERIAPRSAMLRVFAVSDAPGSWQVLPGGLARLAGKNQNISSMQHGGSSADVWVLGAPDSASVGRAPGQGTGMRPTPPRYKPAVTSRAAENLFWLGRYTERTENAVRLAQLTLHSLSGEDQSSGPLLDWLSAMAIDNALVVPKVPSARKARRLFERSLIAGLGDTEQAASVAYNLRALKHAASAVRERLSQEQWQVIVRAESDFKTGCAEITATTSKAARSSSTVEALRALDAASRYLAAITGAQTDRMMRDDGWRLLSIGRHLERLNTLASALVIGFETGAVRDEGGFDAIVALFDSTITFHAQYQQRRDLPALLDLLVLDPDNPRSLAWVLTTLRARLAKLSHTPAGEVPALALDLPDPSRWGLAELCTHTSDLMDGDLDSAIAQGLAYCADQALDLSHLISRRYFSHAETGSHSLGA